MSRVGITVTLIVLAHLNCRFSFLVLGEGRGLVDDWVKVLAFYFRGCPCIGTPDDIVVVDSVVIMLGILCLK